MSKPSLWLSYLSQTERQSHELWLQAGCTGLGRIDIESKNLRGARCQGINLIAARIAKCDLSGSKILYSNLTSIELIDCIWHDVLLKASSFDRSLIKDCQFVAAYMSSTDFVETQVQMGNWSKTILRYSTWTNAQVEKVDFQQTNFGKSKLHNAHFIDCDFTLADMKLAVLHDAVFERCDFRYTNFQGIRLKNTVFSECGFYGCTGIPTVEGEYKLIEADLSPNFDGTVIVEPEQVSQLWGLGTASQQPPEWMTYVSRSQQQQHQDWVGNGHTGLGWINLEGKNLTRAFLYEAYLEWARFVRCDFTFTDLRLAQLKQAEFINCIFDSALLMGLQGEKVQMRDCQGIGATLNRSELRGANISGGDWTGATFVNCMWSGAVVENVCFNNTIWEFAHCQCTRFIGCNFTGADLEDIEAYGAVFERCDLRGANFYGTKIQNTVFKDCSFYNCHGILFDYATEGQEKSQVIAPDLSECGDGTGVVETIYQAESFFQQLDSRYLQTH